MADILVVDDEENLSYSIRMTLEKAGHHCRTATTVSGGVEAFIRRYHPLPDGAKVRSSLDYNWSLNGRPENSEIK